MNSLYISHIPARYTDKQIEIVFRHHKIGDVRHIERRNDLSAIVYIDFHNTHMGQQVKKIVFDRSQQMTIYSDFVDKSQTWCLQKTRKHIPRVFANLLDDDPNLKIDEKFRKIIEVTTQNYNLLARMQYDMMQEFT
jgi:hypothetical protein